jgi:hypothetical protein
VVSIVVYQHSIERIASPNLVLYKISQSPGLPHGFGITLDMKAVAAKKATGAVDRKMEPAGVPPIEVKVKVGLLGCDPPDVAPWQIVTGTEG